MQYNQKQIAARIEKEREALHWPIVKLAEHLNVHRNTLADWEKQGAKGRIPPIDDLIRMCGLFNCELGYLLCEYNCKTRQNTDVQKATGLSEFAINVLALYAETMRTNQQFSVEKSNTEFELKALNHLIANCNSILTAMGLYLFGEFTGLENVEANGKRLSSTRADEFIRNGFMNALTQKLLNYREELLANGGDLPLTLVLDEVKADEKAFATMQFTERLRTVLDREPTDEEIRKEMELWEQRKASKSAEDIKREQALIIFTERAAQSGKSGNLTSEQLSREIDRILEEEEKKGV